MVSASHFGKLISTFLKARSRLETVAEARTGSKTTAEDLLQDAWLRLEKVRSDVPIENPAGFIVSVTKRTVIDHVRKERRRAEIDAEISDVLWDSVDEISPERYLIGRESLEAVCAVLDELPEKTRRIFLMNRIERIPHRRIAEQLGITDEAVYYHIRRALERLAALRDECIG